MKSVCLRYDVPFLRLIEVMEQPSEDIFEPAQAVICDPPYSTHRIEEL